MVPQNWLETSKVQGFSEEVNRNQGLNFTGTFYPVFLLQTFVPKLCSYTELGQIPAFVQGGSSLTFLSLRMKRVRRSQKSVAASPVHTRMITSMLDFSSEPAGQCTTRLEMCPKSLSEPTGIVPSARAHLGF